MNDNIVSASGKAFQQFISHLTQHLTKPKAKFIRQLLCGILFSNNLILTNIASKVPCPGRLTAIAKRFRRQLADSKSYLKQLCPNYLSLVRRRLDMNSQFTVDLSDLTNKKILVEPQYFVEYLLISSRRIQTYQFAIGFGTCYHNIRFDIWLD